jgi:PAS domain S-box-containing protein
LSVASPEALSVEESFSVVAEHAPAMLWRGDTEGRCVYLNKAQREFWGVPDAGIAAFQWSDTLLAEDADKVFGPFSQGMAQRCAFECEARYRRADGAVRILHTRAQPRFDAAGRFTGMVGVNTDVTDVLAAQAELRDSEARLRALADNLPFGMVFQITAKADGSDKRFTFVSGQCPALNGVSVEEAMRDPAALYNRVEPEFREAFAAAERAAVERNDRFQIDAPMRTADGAVRWFRIVSAPRPGIDGEVVWDGVQIDIHDALMAEERRRLLTSEMSHRFKNLLSTILSIAAQTGRSAKSVDAFNAAFQARLRALAQSHDLLQRDASDSADLRELLEAELSPYASGARRSLSLHGDSVRLEGRRAIGFALVVHEMATNAAKYGAYAADGALEISWSVERCDGSDTVHMRWTETGGPPPPQINRQGFGSRLIKAVVATDLGGEADIRFKPEGLQAQFRFLAKLASNGR